MLNPSRRAQGKAKDNNPAKDKNPMQTKEIANSSYLMEDVKKVESALGTIGV